MSFETCRRYSRCAICGRRPILSMSQGQVLRVACPECGIIVEGWGNGRPAEKWEKIQYCLYDFQEKEAGA